MQARTLRLRTLLLTVAVAAVAAGVTFAQTAVNFSGRWQFEGGGGRGGGRGGSQVLILNHVGREVTGELTGGRGGGGSTAPVNNEIYDGKVDGSSISFYVWRGSDRPAKTFYKGTLNATGDEISFTVTGPSRGGGAVGAARAGGPPGAPAESPAPVIARRIK
jgi:hypothetical protein